MYQCVKCELNPVCHRHMGGATSGGCEAFIHRDDMKPVVHARWVWTEENECWVCSNCELSALNNYRGNSTESNYCPHCGAKMDLK